PLAFVVHVGDIGSSTPEQACGDRWLDARKKQFARIRHPFLLIPGDNEWSDCKQPLERLKVWRQFFCSSETIAKLSRQGGEYCEHVRWEQGGWVSVALSLVLASILWTINSRAQEKLPRIKVFATGGTIANTPGGRLHAGEVVEAIPQLKDVARLEVEELMRVGSSAITVANWLTLA